MSQIATDTRQPIVDRWRITVIASTLMFTVLLLLFYVTAENMVRIWHDIETYTHGFIVLPLSIWLIWHKRHHLAAYTPQPSPTFIAFVAASLLVWAMARLSGVQVVEQLAFVGVLITGVATLLGWQVAKFLAFPLLFLLFAVPMGDDLVPPMMEFTASFTVGALKLTGIPVYRDGLWFSVPSGNWSVVEACSGVRYLIASVTLGVMYAYITYHTLWKRLVFIALSAIVPIFANGIRAYMIVMIGHLSDMKYAVGVDHLIYGWIFFGVVMFILFWIGAIWQEEDEPPEHVPPPRALSTVAVDKRVMGLAIVIVLASAATVWSTLRAENLEAGLVDDLQIPSSSASWRKLAEPTLWNSYQPTATQKVQAKYRSDDGMVQLFVAFYPNQSQGVEAINDRNKIDRYPVRYEKLGSPSVPNVSGVSRVNEARAVIESRTGDLEHLVWQWYRIAGHSLTHRYEGKLREAIGRIYPGRSDGVWIAITTPVDPLTVDESRRRLESFAAEMTPTIYAAIDDLLGYAD